MYRPVLLPLSLCLVQLRQSKLACFLFPAAQYVFTHNQLHSLRLLKEGFGDIAFVSSDIFEENRGAYNLSDFKILGPQV